MFTASVVPHFVLSAVLCEVTFNDTPITGQSSARAAPGTTVGQMYGCNYILVLLLSHCQHFRS